VRMSTSSCRRRKNCRARCSSPSSVWAARAASCDIASRVSVAHRAKIRYFSASPCCLPVAESTMPTRRGHRRELPGQVERVGEPEGAVVVAEDVGQQGVLREAEEGREIRRQRELGLLLRRRIAGHLPYHFFRQPAIELCVEIADDVRLQQREPEHRRLRLVRRKDLRRLGEDVPREKLLERPVDLAPAKENVAASARAVRYASNAEPIRGEASISDGAAGERLEGGKVGRLDARAAAVLLILASMSASAPTPAPCPRCAGSGWVPVPGDKFRVEPCGCQGDLRKRQRIAAANIPRRYLDHCTLATFYDKNSPVLVAAKRRVQELIDAWPLTSNGRGLLLMGSCGVGKTHLAVAVLTEIIDSGKAGRLLFTNFQELIQEIQASFDDNSSANKSEILRPLLEADLLVLDELGVAEADDVRPGHPLLRDQQPLQRRAGHDLHDQLLRRHGRRRPAAAGPHRGAPAQPPARDDGDGGDQRRARPPHRREAGQERDLSFVVRSPLSVTDLRATRIEVKI